MKKKQEEAKGKKEKRNAIRFTAMRYIYVAHKKSSNNSNGTQAVHVHQQRYNCSRNSNSHSNYRRKRKRKQTKTKNKMQASICMTCVCICYVVDSPSALLNSFCHCCLSRIKTCRAILLSIDFIRSKKEKKIGLIGHTTYIYRQQQSFNVKCAKQQQKQQQQRQQPYSFPYFLFSFSYSLIGRY